MASPWPPSPCVEDEAAALAREHLIDASIQEVKSDNQPAGNRGSLNQYPIILDVSDDPPKPARPVLDGQSSDESCGPRTPPLLNREPVSSDNTSETSQSNAPKAGRKISRSKSRGRAAESSRTRERPSLSRIRTDVGADLQEMVTGQRRAPSPYAYKPLPQPGKEETRRFSGEQLLSPQSANFVHNGATARSVHGDSRRPGLDRSATEAVSDTDRSQARERRRSRRRSTTIDFGAPRPEQLKDRYESPDQVYVHRSTTQRDIPVSRPDSRNTRASKPQSGRFQKPESPYSSSAEESRRAPSVREEERHSRSTRVSPRTSGDEASLRPPSYDEIRSRRPSTHARQKPKLDPLLHHHSFSGWESGHEKSDHGSHRHDMRHHPVLGGRTYLEPVTPTYSRSPSVMEEMMETAFQDNKTRVNRPNMTRSGQPSPSISPCQTPPRTPRVDRRHLDGFEPTSPALLSARGSRTSSLEQNYAVNPHGPVDQPPLSTPSTTSTSIPSLARTSAASYDLISSDSIGKSGGGQRSWKPSPVYEEPRPLSRAGSTTGQEGLGLSRAATVMLSNDRPASRGSPGVYEPLAHPRPVQRAFSYNCAVDPAGSRPSSSHRMSSTLAPSSPLVDFSKHLNGAKTVPMADARLAVGGEALPPPCPRATSHSGLADWYTIRGTPEIDICPSCMATLGNSRFRDHFVPSLPKPRTQAIQCSFSKPWMRVAWLQLLRQSRSSLGMLRDLVHRPASTKPCLGQKLEVRPWYRITDTRIGRPVPKFQVCAACVYAIDTIFPNLHGALERPSSLLEESSCSLTTDSKRFSKYITEFEKAHIHCNGKRYRDLDVQGLADFARTTCRKRECPKDQAVAQSTWHFSHSFPDFTICEECYDEVVLPLAGKPIARDISLSLQPILDSPYGRFSNGRTCQLYSERMRRLFREAVKYNDIEVLRAPASKRLEVELLLREKHALLLSDVRAGYDRMAEFERNAHIWSTWE